MVSTISISLTKPRYSECKDVPCSILLAKPVPEVQSPLLSPQVQVLEIPVSFPVRQRAAASNDRASCALASLHPLPLAGPRARGGLARPALSRLQPAHSSVSSWRSPQARRAPSTSNTYTALVRTEGTEDEELQDKKANRRPSVALGALQISLQAEPQGNKSLSSPRTAPEPPKAAQPPGRAPERAQPARPHTLRWQRPGQVKDIE